jgi:hypothetical protein
MEANRRFTILTFPQHFDGNKLKLNILFLPRNQNPLNKAVELNPDIPDAPAFADATLSFQARIVSGLDNFPMNSNVSDTVSLPIAAPNPAKARALFTALAASFQVSNLGQANTNTNLSFSEDKAPGAIKKEEVSRSIRKYLPGTYRQSFNFIAPKVKNAVIDDSYLCAVRDAKKQDGFKQSGEKISWGKVLAFALRQPQLAKELGIIYETELTIKAVHFPKGGWLYIDVTDDSDFKPQETASENVINAAADPLAIKTQGLFLKKYAARIPALELGKERTVFAALQFPVLYKKPAAITDPAPEGNFDNLFIEAAAYDDGFSKIVHSFQPRSNNFLLEESDGFHPTKESGIRLGWDDEQILIWYMRQLMEDESIGGQQRIDAPLGVFGYRLDVREKGAADWNPLNAVNNKIPLAINGESLQDFSGELPYQVYPSQLDGDKNKSYWLPMYFANWNGKSMVLPDDEAISIYQNDQDVKADPLINVTGAPQNGLSKTYTQVPIHTSLLYGKIYDFRVRLSDLTGGGPDAGGKPVTDGESPVTTCHFKRYVAPTTVRVQNVPPNDDGKVFEDASLKIQRPLLGYPAVVFTGKYANAVALLKQASQDLKGVEAFGLADPNVETVEITVEVQALKMDNLLSVSGKESYIKFYTTSRKFPGGFDDILDIPIEYRDCNVLNFGDPSNLGDLGLSQAQLDGLDQLVLPKARSIRLTLRAVCEKIDGYYGLENTDPVFNTRYGTTRYVMLYKASADERSLFANTSPAARMKGIYLQPDPPVPFFDGNLLNLFTGKQVEKLPDMIQRLAQALELESTGLTLVGKKGKRVQFGCSAKIRHSLSPDHSSITFASKGDLMNHWLCCITLQVNRDWTWDALEDLSFIVTRKKSFKKDAPGTAPEILEVGDIEVKKTISINALQNPGRNDTTLVFIDAVEPKNDPKFPDLIELEYTIETRFRAGHASQKDAALVLQLELPVTNIPGQLPKIASAGLALSPYRRNEKYSDTETRRRYLWVEFEEPVLDPDDLYFARVLAYAPDQLLSNNHPELLVPPDEPTLPIDTEYIRIITPDQPDDDAGINAMQPMEKAVDSDKHYLLPIPPGLHEESPELFGFFTYEFRVGHASIWSTAQGRFGRALRATGIQHPAPSLTCTVNRDEIKLYVTAPYAVTVYKGKNVTADPPRTEIWALLYAQVKQADGKDYRNILLHEKKLDWRVRVEHKKNVNRLTRYTAVERNTLKYISVKNWSDELSYAKLDAAYQLTDYTTVNKDATKYGTAIWSNTEVNQLLALYGLPLDSPLSVLCVEMLPTITNIYDAVTNIDTPGVATKLRTQLQTDTVPDEFMAADVKSQRASMALINEGPSPLSDQLGQYRILRTSPLVAVPFVCCTDC